MSPWHPIVNQQVISIKFYAKLQSMATPGNLCLAFCLWWKKQNHLDGVRSPGSDISLFLLLHFIELLCRFIELLRFIKLLFWYIELIIIIEWNIIVFYGTIISI